VDALTAVLEPGVLRCQQTLGPLQPRDGVLHSPEAGLDYAVRDGIVLMGYDERDAAFIEQTMEEERVHQGTSATVHRDLEFLRASAPSVVDALNLLDLTGAVRPGARALDVGSGSGWGSWLLARAGYDTWLIDFEPNSLALGLVFADPRLEGRRIAGDGTLLPFADGTFDVVLCKEFAHHVPDKARLLAEINRVTAPGGTLVFMEPIRSVRFLLQDARQDAEEHSAHSIAWSESYLRALRAAGFDPFWRGRYFTHKPTRSSLTARLKARSTADLRAGRSRRDPLGWLYEHTFGGGGGLVVLARRTRTPGRPRPRPALRLLDPALIRVTDADRQTFAPLRDVLEAEAARLRVRAGDGVRPSG